MLNSKRANDFNSGDVFAMSQIIGGAYRCNHLNSMGERIDDHYTVSGSTGVVKGRNRHEIDKIIGFLRRQAIIKIHREYLVDIDGHDNIGYEITLTTKGRELAIGRHTFSDYYHDFKSKEDKEELAIQEMRANIYLPVFAILISTLISWWTYDIGSDTENKVNKLSVMVDSLRQDLILSKSKIDSLTIFKNLSVDSIERTSKSAKGVGKYASPQLRKL